MRKDSKPVDKLNEKEIKEFPVWQFTNSDVPDETYVFPLKKLPVKSLSNRIVFTEFTLANKHKLFGSIANVSLENQRLNQHFISISILKNEDWFHLARYFDFDYNERNPNALAKFLNIPIDDIFPLSIDISKYCVSDQVSLILSYPKEPIEKLTRSEVIALAVP